MKISKFYNNNASEQWFNKKYGKSSVHDSLAGKGFEIVDRNTLTSMYAEQELPATQLQFSWGGSFPSPTEIYKNTFLAKEMYEIGKSKYRSEHLPELLSRWMQSMPVGDKFLVSLNPQNYLVATAESIEFSDVYTVYKTWNVDSWIGVFDKRCSMVFIFDIEFGVVTTSFDPLTVPNGYEEFSRFYNDEFREVFVRDAKFRTGADPSRAQEYMDKIQHLIS